MLVLLLDNIVNEVIFLKILVFLRQVKLILDIPVILSGLLHVKILFHMQQLGRIRHILLGHFIQIRELLRVLPL